MRITPQIWLGLVLCLAAALILVLARQNATLREELYAQAPQPRVGQWVPAYKTTSLDGVQLSLGDSSKTNQVLYFFHPNCPHCIASEPAMTSIAAQLGSNSESVEFVGLSAAPEFDLANYAQRKRVAFPVVHLDTKKMFSLFQIDAVPVLIVVNREVIIRYSHAGEIVGAEAASRTLHAIEEALRSR